MKKNGVKLMSATEVISEGPEGIILESVLEGYAEYYSADLSEKVVKNQRGGEMSYNTIQRMLSNRRYIGELCLRDVVQPNAIPALVSGELVGVRPLHLATQDRSVA